MLTLNLFCETELPKSVEKIINKAFLNKTPYSISKSFENNIKTLPNPKEKSLAFSILADYEDRSELYYSAAKHYIMASELALSQNKKGLLVKAMASALLASKITMAYDICTQNLLSSIQENKSQDDIKVLVCFEWIKLKLLEDNKAYTIEDILAKLRSYVVNSEFSEFHPAILLTLWWIDNDQKAENTLLKKYPNSLEAGIIKGTVTLSPKVFWYLMPHSPIAESEEEVLVSEADADESSSKQAVEEHSAKLYQVGFFKNPEYAKRLSKELKNKGFDSIVNKKQQKNETFYSVLVKPDKKGNMVLRLKNEGYEAVPIF